MYMYVSDDGPKKPSNSAHYKLGQTPPPRHWYQRRVGWFGRFVAVSSVLLLAGTAGGAFTIIQNGKKSLAAQTAQSTKLNGTKPTLSTDSSIENIVDLQPILDKWNTDHPGQKWAVVAKSIAGPSFDARLNADDEFRSASIYKLFLTLPLFNQVPVERQAKTKIAVNGSQKTIASCVDVMLRVSNNECGEALGAYAQWKKIDSTLHEKGFKNTTFNQPEGIQTSAGDTAAFLEGLYADMFPAKARETILKSLYQQRWRDGIPAGCPGCTVANKTGQINDVVHDAAIVQYKGGTYVLAIFSKHGSFKEIAKLTGQIQQRILDTQE